MGRRIVRVRVGVAIEMPVSFDQYCRDCVDAGLLGSAEVDEARTANPEGDAQALARWLVKREMLTAFQAQQAFAGRAKTLVLGNYVLLDKLGQGGMGAVYKALHRRMKRLVALKVLSPDLTRTDESIQRFQREVEAAARLEHPNIVTAFDADCVGKTHFLVMQFVDGPDLSTLVKRKGPLAVDKGVHCVLQAARGLAYAHGRGIVHRDIKPANLLMNREGVLKILDMGLASFSDRKAAAELTHSGAMLGTVDYMPPEQALDTRSADARSDIYSLGITLWYLLVGRAAYDGDSMMAKLLAHRDAPLPSLGGARGEVPTALDMAFRRMIAKKPEDRFQTMDEVIAALEDVMAGTETGPSLSVEPSELEKLERELRDQRAAGSTAALATIQDTVRPTPRRSKSSWNDRARRFARDQPLWVAGGAAAVLAVILALWLGPRSSRTAGEANSGGSGDGTVAATTGSELSSSPPVKTGKNASTRGSAAGAATPVDVVSAGQRDTVASSDAVKKDSTPNPKGPPTSTPNPPPPAAATVAPSPLGWPFDEATAKAAQSAWALHIGGDVVETNAAGMEMVIVPPGTFLMGSPPEEFGHDDTETQVSTTIGSPFRISRHEVTQDLWSRVMGTVPWKGQPDARENPRHAASHVTWDESREFCRKLSQLTARSYRLPTEAEWEWACRAGCPTIYSFGGDDKDLGQHAWWGGYGGDGNAKAERYAHAVGEKRPNRFGLFDIHGNVWEWCEDVYEDRLRGGLDPVGTGSSKFRVYRGGGWNGLPAISRSANRARLPPDARMSYVGLRPVETLKGRPSTATLASTNMASTTKPPNAVSAATFAAPMAWPCDEALAAAAQAAWAKATQRTVVERNSVGMDMVLIPPGSFKIGSPPEEPGHHPVETQVDVTLSRPFRLARTPVTVEQFRQFVLATGYVTEAERDGRGGRGWNGDTERLEGPDPRYGWANTGWAQTDRHPVVNVTWRDANAFCGWLGIKEGATYRLPTEAEREWSCRAGSATRFYCGDNAADLITAGNVADDSVLQVFPGMKNHVPGNDGFPFTSPVGSFPPNAFGLHDMLGNVWEWCQDWHSAANPGGIDPVGIDPASGRRATRGGSWMNVATEQRSAARGNVEPTYRSEIDGFRVLRTE